MIKFKKDHLNWTSGQKALGTKTVKRWYDAWRRETGMGDAVAAVAAVAVLPLEKSALRSRAPVANTARQRATGAGPKFKAFCVRQALYEWFVSIRYAIDWKQMIAENRSRGTKTLGPISPFSPEAQIDAASPRLCVRFLTQRRTCWICQG